MNPVISVSTPEVAVTPWPSIWKRIREDADPQARDTVLSKYAYLVRFVIGRMKIRFIPTLDRDDLESAGAIGLIKAVDRFDPTMNVKFETYAYRWIQGHILDYVRSLDPLSRLSRERVTEFKQAQKRLRDQHSRDPQEHELMEALGISAEDLRERYLDLGHSETLSLNVRYNSSDSDDESSWVNELCNEKEVSLMGQAERQETLEQVKTLINTLPEKEKLVLSLYYYEDLTLKEIGTILNVSESRVCQLHSKAILSIQQSLVLE